MDNEIRTKEVGPDGLPIQRLSSYLISDVHQSLSESVDRMLRNGWINDAEYVTLTATLNEAVGTFQKGIPSGLAERAYGASAYDAAAQAKAEEAAEKMSEIVQAIPPSAPATPAPMPMYADLPSEKTTTAVQGWLSNFTNTLNRVLNKEDFDDSEWNGSASEYKTAAAYCAACLIDTNPSGEPKIKDRCHLPIRKEGSKAINKNALRALASGGRGISALKGVSGADKAKAAKFAISHWQSAFGKPAPASMYQMAGMKAPATMKGKAASMARFFKDKQGDWWMLGIYSNRWKDFQGEILSEDSHAEYAEWVNSKGFEPAVTLAHLPRLSAGFWINTFKKFGNDIPSLNEIVGDVYKDYGFARVKRIIPLNGFAIALAKVDSSKTAIAERLSKVPDTGMSHGCVSFKEHEDFNLDTVPVTIVDKYRSFELTVLLRNKAANAVTIPIFVEAREMAKELSKEDRDLLVQVLPVELVDNVDQITAELEKGLNERLAFKDVPAEEAGEASSESLEDQVDSIERDAPIESTSSAAVDAIVQEVIKALNVDALKAVLSDIKAEVTEVSGKVAQIEELKTQVKELKKSDDQKIAAQIGAPTRPGVDWGFVASKSEKTAVPENGKQKTKESKPKPVVGDPALSPEGGQMDMNNPMNALLYSRLTKS